MEGSDLQSKKDKDLSEFVLKNYRNKGPLILSLIQSKVLRAVWIKEQNRIEFNVSKRNSHLLYGLGLYDVKGQRLFIKEVK